MKKERMAALLLAAAVAVSATACGAPAAPQGPQLNAETKPASQYTIDANDQVYALLDFSDRTEFENAERGLIASPESLEIRDANGKLVWSQDAYAFLENDAPDTANPSLWRNAQLNHISGLFEVTDGIYQVRGYDMTNITFIKGDTGWIIVDPLMSVECAQAAFALVKENLGDYPVKAIIYSHPHVDHFGGVRGVVDEADVLSGAIPVIAPEGFEKHAISENVYSGNAMGRRASYQYGTIVKSGETGSLSIGIGMGQSTGLASYISPTQEIHKTGEKLVLDGVQIEFQLTPGTEAPAEMNFWIGEKNALWMAENCTGTMHNLYTLRGAQVRDGNAWAEYIMETISLYGDKAKVVFQSHNWPHWENEVIGEYLLNTAAAYKFINDQTLLYINEGYTETEIANMIKLPENLEKVWYTRQYYGTVSHNSKAVYEKYMGWYDGNPIHLAELTPTDYAKKMVAYLGDKKAVMEMAKKDFENGEYQWVAQITNMLVFDDPSDMDARYLCADALEQLAYQAESGPWRNAYLRAVYELRNGTNDDPGTRAGGASDAIAHMTPEMVFDYLGILVDTSKVSDLSFTANVVLPRGSYVLRVVNGVLLYQVNAKAEDADVTWTTNLKGLLSIVQKNAEGVTALVAQEGDETCLAKLLDAITVMTDYRFFNIIEP
ncbi:MAG: MBL fold metallo-hydrolase [Clostridia bacterium]|nr:MBL fold metallo-hydrolase [Clostridia bacterium]